MTTQPTPQFGDNECGSNSGPAAERTFVMGAASGLRTFRVGDDGWLRGVSYRQVWRPGENLARCFAAKPNKLPRGLPPGAPKTYNSLGAWAFPVDPDAEPFPLRHFDPNPCDGLNRECSCGFYAYHVAERTNRYGTGMEPHVEGIVQGYGKVVLGPYGFRAEKARVVALVVKHEPPASVRRMHELQEAMFAASEVLRACSIKAVRVGRHPRRIIYMGVSLLGAAAVAPAIAPFAMAVLGAITTFAVAGETIDRKFLAVVRRELKAASDQFHEETEQLLASMRAWAKLPELISRNYPGVPIYSSREEMLKAHPLPDLDHLAPAPANDAGL